jgi:hypothetical protein
MTTTLRVGEFGVDAYGNNGFQADPLVEAGVSFLTGYVCQDNTTTHPKIIRPDVWARLERFTRILNYEWYEGRCIIPGAAAVDAPLVLRMIADGRPTDVVIVSCDMNVGGVTVRNGIPGWFTRPAELPICAAELATHQHAYAAAGVRLGVYGGGWLIRWLIDNGPKHGLDPSTILWWQPPFAWSEDNGGGHYIPAEVHILQAGGSVIGGVSVDHNHVVRAYSTSDTPPPPPNKDDDMPEVWDLDGTLMLIRGTQAMWLPGRDAEEAATAAEHVAMYGPVRQPDQRALRTVYLDGELPSYPPNWPRFKATADMFRQPQPVTPPPAAACQFAPTIFPTRFTGTVDVHAG